MESNKKYSEYLRPTTERLNPKKQDWEVVTRNTRRPLVRALKFG
jgi:hypothetical protein